MENPIELVVNSTSKAHLSAPSKRAVIFLIVLIAVLGSTVGGALVYAESYKDRVLPGIHAANIPVGGMNKAELVSFFAAMDGKLSSEPVRVTVDMNGKEEKLLIYNTGTDVVQIDIEHLSDYFLAYGKEGNVFSRAWRVLGSFEKTSLSVDYMQIDTQSLVTALKQTLSPFETKAKDADLLVTTLVPYAYEVTPSVTGIEFSYDTIINDIVSSWSLLEVPALTVSPRIVTPSITEAAIAQVGDKGPSVLVGDMIVLTYTDTHAKRDFSWKISAPEFSKWLEPQDKGGKGLVLGFDQEQVEAYLKKTVEPSIHQEPKNAKFSMANGKITEFQGSQPGTTLKYEDAYQAINTIATERFLGATVTSSIALQVTSIEPDITTASVNDLGIEEVLGVGYSSYKGSPANRIKNIRFAVNKKLNGLLVKPGETFSMIDALKPFTIEGGYLAELVIKGDRIIPEVGGGLCQVGSTMFRAAMNSGMDIVERRNHSLAISYYNDHRNNLPGVDATIYDPAPDFKFKNDTDSHILIMTEMNEKTSELFFTIWGKNDGRKGYYGVPSVKQWIPMGPTKEVVTADMTPGQRKCQEGHVGAVASFTYYREMPNGEKIPRVFESHYRALPRICLVGGVPTTPADGVVPTAPGGEIPVAPGDAPIPVE